MDHTVIKKPSAATLRWRAHVKARQAAGECINCPKDDLRAATHGQRCGLHARINQAKCLLWTRAHPEKYAEENVRKKALVDSGRCAKCWQHRKVAKGRRSCRPCLRRHAEHNQRLRNGGPRLVERKTEAELRQAKRVLRVAGVETRTWEIPS
jgi:hypothetical protein